MDAFRWAEEEEGVEEDAVYGESNLTFAEEKICSNNGDLVAVHSKVKFDLISLLNVLDR